MNEHYIDTSGKYLGAYLGGAEPPDGAIAVPGAPAHGTDTWSGRAWVASPARLREQFKTERAARVAAIVVTVDGLQFDGDEVAQGRMSRAVQAMTYAGENSTLWVLANNFPMQITRDQLQRALVAAGLAQSAVWVAPV